MLPLHCLITCLKPHVSGTIKELLFLQPATCDLQLMLSTLCDLRFTISGLSALYAMLYVFENTVEKEFVDIHCKIY
jgi:hypothetical protein